MSKQDDRLLAGLIRAANHATAQAPRIKECRKRGHQWEPFTDTVIDDDMSLDIRCSHCGTLGNRDYEDAQAKGD